MAIWTARDRLDREVVLTEERLAHIIDEHPEVASSLADLRAAVESPDRSTRDRRAVHGECHYRRESASGRWLRVVVHYGPVPPQRTWAGRVVTAHFVRNVSRKEQPLWP